MDVAAENEWKAAHEGLLEEYLNDARAWLAQKAKYESDAIEARKKIEILTRTTEILAGKDALPAGDWALAQNAAHAQAVTEWEAKHTA